MQRFGTLLAAVGSVLLLAGCPHSTLSPDVVDEGTDNRPDDPVDAGVCVPACGDRVCGDDGCGGTCGSCPPTAICDTMGHCKELCQPDCADRECGDDGCGGSCGECNPTEACTQGKCSAEGALGYPCESHADCLSGWCIPTEDGHRCTIPCVEECPTGWHCEQFEQAMEPVFLCVPDCVPACAGKPCGADDGCGGTCPQCPAGPCLELSPGTLDFGVLHLGEQKTLDVTLTSCGDAPVLVLAVELGPTTDDDFALDPGLYPPGSGDPLVMAPGQQATVTVTYIPDEANPLSADGTLIPDTGTLTVLSDATEGPLTVQLLGAGKEGGGECPVAVIHCAEGAEVIPQTVLHLYGDDSYAPVGTIQGWEWDVDQPMGSQSVFVPSSAFPNPTFATNVAGAYSFSLAVTDHNGISSCLPALFDVVVIPDEAIHVELLWHNPEDPDETDTGPEAGADLDLHFLHPWAAGPDLDGDGEADGWFDLPFDCFWFNGHPNWGEYDPTINDDPGLDRDDTDGAGPENINLDIPEDVLYRVGVHYWNDHGFGTAFATVRVYIYSQMTLEVPDVELADMDMWSVCTIEWPGAHVQVILDDNGGWKIIPEYANPYFFQ